MLKFKIGECSVCISGSFFALVTFILLLNDSTIALISLLSALSHEIGHILVMIFLGGRIKSLVFSATGIRLEKSDETSFSYEGEIILSLAGIAVNGVLSVLFAVLYRFYGNTVLRDIALVNMLVGGFNLLPIETLDGERAFHCLLLKNISREMADKISFAVSVATIISLIAVGAVISFYAKTNYSLIIVTLYLIILLINHIIELKKS